MREKRHRTHMKKAVANIFFFHFVNSLCRTCSFVSWKNLEFETIRIANEKEEHNMWLYWSVVINSRFSCLTRMKTIAYLQICVDYKAIITFVQTRNQNFYFLRFLNLIYLGHTYICCTIDSPQLIILVIYYVCI